MIGNITDNDKDKKKLGFILSDTLYKTEKTQKFKENPLENFTETVNNILHIKPEEYNIPLNTEFILKNDQNTNNGTGVAGDTVNANGAGDTVKADGADRADENDKKSVSTDTNKKRNITSGGYVLEDSEYQKLNNLIFDIENDIMRPINKLDISKEDRIVFIGVTFIIRFICLSIIEWGMNTNFISSFQQIFLFYCAIYITIFCFITMIVNVIYNYPLQQLYSDHSIVNISSTLYYFYIYTNGPMRLVIHLMFIIILMLIPFIINIGNNQFDTIDFNYETKKNTRNILSRFTLVIWIITSIIAIRY